MIYISVHTWFPLTVMTIVILIGIYLFIRQCRRPDPTLKRLIKIVNEKYNQTETDKKTDHAIKQFEYSLNDQFKNSN